jgi:uncharacterized protein YjbI with pentapeptide repeats
LNGAHLQAATLDAAQLYHARLDGSDLRGASLKRAQLHGADLSEANLGGVWHVKRDRSVTNLCDLRSLIFSRSTLNDQGQAVSLETKKVIDAAIKNTSGLADTLTKDLESLFGTGRE